MSLHVLSETDLFKREWLNSWMNKGENINYVYIYYMQCPS